MHATATLTDQVVRTEHIKTLYRLMPRALPVYPLGGLLMVATLWNQQPHAQLLAWLVALFLITIARAWLVIRFRRNPPTPDQVTKWGHWTVASTFASGLLLGISVVAFLDPAQPLSLLVIAGIIMGATSGGLGSLSPYPASYWGLIIPSMGPLIVMLFVHAEPATLIIAVVCILMQVTNIFTCQTLFRAMDTSLRVSHENQVLLRKMQQANQAKTRFLAAASHDLRQPLHALGLFFATLSDQVTSPRTRGLLARIDETLRSVGSMLTSILDISKLDAGIVKPQVESLRLDDLFTRLDQEFTPLALQNGNQLTVRPTQLSLRTDPSLFERILRNLIANAVRYTHDGRILVSAHPGNGLVRCEVRDNGPGIAPQQQEAIFEEFYQVDNPERDRSQGMGLGLAIVQRHAALLDHRLDLQSSIGQGACFSVSAPQASLAPNSPAEVHDDRQPADFSGKQVLLVDDDPIVVEGMSVLLEHWGCEVLRADSPRAAVDILTQTGAVPDLLVTDYRLTDGATGKQVIDQVDQYAGAGVPAIIITGDTAPERLIEANQAGHPLLHKPVAPSKLRTTMRDIFEAEQ